MGLRLAGLADAVFTAGDVPPAVVVFVDAWTAYGGSQFVDSPGTGRYHSYLCEEVVPFVGALASHAGDSLYELCYLAEFGKSVRHLRDYDGDIGAWWAEFLSRPAFTKPADEHLLMMLGISACFSTRGDGTPELPFDPRSGVLRPLAGLGSGADGTAVLAVPSDRPLDR